MNRRFGFFPYGAMDYKAAQAYLDRKAAAGWVLKWVRLNCLARFEPAEGRVHFVDLDLSRSMDGGPDPDYLQLCADAGWEKVKALRGMVLFRSRSGARPAPIQTDDGMEQERFWKGYVRRHLLSSFWSAVSVGVAWGILSVWDTSFSQLVLRNGPLLLLLILVLLLVGGVWSGLSTLFYYRRCTREGRVAVPGRRGAAAQGTLSILTAFFLLLSGVLSIAESLGLGTTVDLGWGPGSQADTATPEVLDAYPVVLGSDLGTDPAYSFSRYLDGRRSLLVDSLVYSEVVSGGDGPSYILTTERYDCAGAAVARWLIGQRKLETERGDFLWGDLPWSPAPGLGFDESYSTPDGSYLLLRQGDTVALVGCSGLDLTQRPRPDTLRVRLGVEGKP